MRLEAGALLKRFHLLERALVRACAGWISAVHPIESKALLARIAWESSLTADALHERVFELRYPSRLMEVGVDAPLMTLFRGSVHAPSSIAFLDALGTVFLPALRDAENGYLELTDEFADGPTRRFLAPAGAEKDRALTELAGAVENERENLDGNEAEVDRAWVDAVRSLLEDAGGAGIADPRPIDVSEVVPPGVEHSLPGSPARDRRYVSRSFYWPDTLDPEYACGSGIRLQLRSAVSHLNEVWAVEIAGAALYELGDVLGWEFVLDAARWTYDESRHMLMGQRRLAQWGLAPANVPLGRYIYEASVGGGDPLYRLGMLGFFETKYIGKKMERAREFAELGDELSQRDLQFDWADETIHAEYGRRWLKRLLEVNGRPADDYADVLEECERLVSARIALAEPGELEEIRRCVERLVAEAERVAAAE